MTRALWRMPFGPRRGLFIEIDESETAQERPWSPDELSAFERLDAIYRRLVAVMFNFVPTSGHPGGSISAGRISEALVFDGMDCDVSSPWRDEADLLSFAAGHKALGLYALLALRDEIVGLGAPHLLPKQERLRLRLEDLLGFRRNPTTQTPLFAKHNAKALDGHPTPATPFVRLATGASGVGLASSIGLAWGLLDHYGDKAPRVHIVEGEGGLTPGRAAEALAAAGTASLKNIVLHVDWNQASIDSDHVCRSHEQPGDYVQWDPVELCYLHDWNVILVPNGHDFRQVATAQRHAASLDTGQPTAIVYRTVKGWGYGIEGSQSHGAGHRFCSPEFYSAVNGLPPDTRRPLMCSEGSQCCQNGANQELVEGCYWEALKAIRSQVSNDTALVSLLAERVVRSRQRLEAARREPRSNAADVKLAFAAAHEMIRGSVEKIVPQPGATTTLRETLARAIGYLNRSSGGSFLVASADLVGSTSIKHACEGFGTGYFHSKANAQSRLLATGGICEDAMTGILSGISMAGHHIGVGSSYGAFLASLGHTSLRLHAIGNQARQHATGEPCRPMFLVCAHAGVKTGEDGPTHADPQCLQLVQDNFPRGAAISLTPWEPQEIPALVATALLKRPAVIVAFVTRPSERVLDRESLGLARSADAMQGVYLLRKAPRPADGVVVLQGSEVANAFVQQALPLLVGAGVEIDAYYVSSAELFDLLPEREQERIFPNHARHSALGITGFTAPTLWRWISSERGRLMSLHPFKAGRFLGSGRAEMVLHEAGLDGEAQFCQILRYVRGEHG